MSGKEVENKLFGFVIVVLVLGFLSSLTVGCTPPTHEELKAQDNGIIINGYAYPVFKGSDGCDYIEEHTYAAMIYVHSGSCKNSIHHK